MDNELKVSFYIKREGSTERTGVNPRYRLSAYRKNHYWQLYCPIQFQTENRRTALEC